MQVRRQPKPFLLSYLSDPKIRLQCVRDVLNRERRTKRGKELSALVAKWGKSANLDAMLRDDPSLGMELHYAARPYFEASTTGKGGFFRVVAEPPNERVGSDRSHTPIAHQAFVVWMFAHLVTNPLCEKLAGPCARCGRYYIKKRATQKVYCSRRCGNAATATIRTRTKLAEQHRKKLERAKASMQEWSSPKTRTSLDWKQWVSNRTMPINDRESTITPKFLTRAVNKGELKAPRKG